MDRRAALKNITYGLGYAISAPTALSILNSCVKKDEPWEAKFFTKEEQKSVIYLTDIILPSTDTPGATDVNVPEFIDKLFFEIESEENKEYFKKGALVFIEKYEQKFSKKIDASNKEEVAVLFAELFELNEEEKRIVLTKRFLDPNNLEGEELSNFMLYKFLFLVKEMTLFGYFTSEKVGKEVLNFDPIPGEYKPCIPVKDIGNAWTI